MVATVPKGTVFPLKLRTLNWAIWSGGHAKAGIPLQIDLPGPAELIEIVGVKAAEIRLQRQKDFIERNSQRLALRPVHIHIHLRRAGSKRGKEPDQARLLVSFFGEVIGSFLQGIEAERSDIPNHHFEAAGISQAIDGWRAEDRNLGFLHLAIASRSQLAAIASELVFAAVPV